MLFTIKLGDNLNLGLLMCILFIFLPIVLRLIKFIRQDALEELDDKIDESRTFESTSSSRNQTIRMSPTEVYTYTHSFSKRRRR